MFLNYTEKDEWPEVQKTYWALKAKKLHYIVWKTREREGGKKTPPDWNSHKTQDYY